jgi:G2/mitotic-specific cyclin 1/2
MLLSTIGSAEFDKQYVYKKYSNKKFLRASTFARDWVRGRSNQYGLVGFKPLSS